MTTPTSSITADCVLDVSVSHAWGLWNHDPYAQQVISRMIRLVVVVPHGWWCQILDRTRVDEQKRKATTAEVDQLLRFLAGLPIQVDPSPDSSSWPDVVRLARKHQCPPCEVAYLELALRLSLPLATIDKRLRRLAVAEGVSLFVP